MRPPHPPRRGRPARTICPAAPCRALTQGGHYLEEKFFTRILRRVWVRRGLTVSCWGWIHGNCTSKHTCYQPGAAKTSGTHQDHHLHDHKESGSESGGINQQEHPEQRLSQLEKQHLSPYRGSIHSFWRFGKDVVDVIWTRALPWKRSMEQSSSSVPINHSLSDWLSPGRERSNLNGNFLHPVFVTSDACSFENSCSTWKLVL